MRKWEDLLSSSTLHDAAVASWPPPPTCPGKGRGWGGRETAGRGEEGKSQGEDESSQGEEGRSQGKEGRSQAQARLLPTSRGQLSPSQLPAKQLYWVHCTHKLFVGQPTKMQKTTKPNCACDPSQVPQPLSSQLGNLTIKCDPPYLTLPLVSEWVQPQQKGSV